MKTYPMSLCPECDGTTRVNNGPLCLGCLMRGKRTHLRQVRVVLVSDLPQADLYTFDEAVAA